MALLSVHSTLCDQKSVSQINAKKLNSLKGSKKDLSSLLDSGIVQLVSWAMTQAHFSISGSVVKITAGLFSCHCEEYGLCERKDGNDDGHKTKRRWNSAAHEKPGMG